MWINECIFNPFLHEALFLLSNSQSFDVNFSKMFYVKFTSQTFYMFSDIWLKHYMFEEQCRLIDLIVI